MKRLIVVSAVLGCAFLQPLRAQAQVNRIEFGIDMGLERINPTESGFGDGTVTVIGIPTQWVRLGLALQDNIWIEPRIGIARVSSDGESLLQARLPVAVLYRVQPSPDGPSFFFEGLGGVDFVRASSNNDSESTTQFRVGAGAGVLVPMVTNVAFRAAAEYHRSFETDEAVGADHIILTAGLSFLIGR